MRLLLVILATFATAQAADYKLKASPATVAFGYYWSEAKPVLRIRSGDTVQVQTLTTATPASLARVGVKDEDIEPELKAIFTEVTGDRKGPGGHILTGPIFIEDAEPGDVLEVRIQKVQLAVPYATNGFSPQRGVLPATDFQQGRTKLIPLDTQRNVARSADISKFRCILFSAAWALPRILRKAGSTARHRVITPAISTTRIWSPARSCLFQCTCRAKWPRGETPTHWIAMGLDPDLTQALILAVREAMDFLVTEKHLSREEAYALCSMAVDFNVTQAVDGTKGVHGMIPKNIFK